MASMTVGVVALAGTSLTSSTYELNEMIGHDDDIEWPENPFDYREDQNTDTMEELLAMIRFKGSVGF